MKMLVTVVTAAGALAVAAWLLDGISVGGADRGQQLLTLLVVAVLFGLVNAVVRPVVALLSLPFYIFTLGLFFLVVNALMLLLTSWITRQLGIEFTVDGFWTAVLGGIVISLASAAIGLLVPDPKD